MFFGAGAAGKNTIAEEWEAVASRKCRRKVFKGIKILCVILKSNNKRRQRLEGFGKNGDWDFNWWRRVKWSLMFKNKINLLKCEIFYLYLCLYLVNT